MKARAVALVVVVAATALAVYVLLPGPAPIAAAPAPPAARSPLPPAPPAHRPSPAPTPGPIAEPPPGDPMAAIGAQPLLDEVADTGLVITPAKMRAAQLHLLPVTTDAGLPADEATLADTLEALGPDASHCLPDAESDTAVEVQRVPMLDGSGNVLQVAALPQGHGGPETLACLTEVLRSVRFEAGPASAATWVVPPN